MNLLWCYSSWQEVCVNIDINLVLTVFCAFNFALCKIPIAK